jgi:spermidine/putrescine transport system ATP-binding protein
MNEGRVEQRGSALMLYEQPRTVFVAGFLGSSNLLDGEMVGKEEFRTRGGKRIQVLAPSHGGDRAGVRPEKVTLVSGEDDLPDGAVNVLEGQVTVASFLGTAIQYVVTTSEGEELMVVEQNRSHEPVGPGRKVRLAWRPEDTFVVAS